MENFIIIGSAVDVFAYLRYMYIKLAQLGEPVESYRPTFLSAAGAVDCSGFSGL